MKLVILFSLLIMGVVHGLPSNCEICTRAIDLYSGNGGGAPDLGTCKREGLEYANQGVATINAKYPQSYPEYVQEAFDKSCQKWTFTPQGHWSCNFLQYGGHADQSTMFLGNGANYGKVYPSDLKLGANGFYPWLSPKWFHTRACDMFWEAGRGGTNIYYWSSAFMGLHTMLAYGSLSYDTQVSGQPATDFWNRWVTLSQSIWTAYSESEATYGYQRVSGATGITVGCLSATRTAGGNYCDLSYVNEDSKPAPNGATYYVSKVYGSPIYQ